MDRDEIAALDEVAVELGRSRSDLIREAIRSTWLSSRTGTAPSPGTENAVPDGTEVAVEAARRERRRQWDEVLTAFRRDLPAGINEDLETDIRAAHAEVREERRIRAGCG